MTPYIPWPGTKEDPDLDNAVDPFARIEQLLDRLEHEQLDMKNTRLLIAQPQPPKRECALM